jgi:glycosyltransferase involved in cell wall biosynthesis
MTLDEPTGLAIDIVIDNHNYGVFVTQAIDSACGQGHPDVHVVVVDDGSTDDSRERLSAYEGAVDIVLKENGGQASAFNAGVARCRGDIVMFLDADDVLRPDAAARVAAAFSADPRVVRVQFRMDVIDAEGRPTGATKPPRYLPMPSGDLTQAVLAFPFDLVWLPVSGNAFRLDALRRIFPIPEHEYPRCGADWYLVHLTSLLGSVVSLEGVGASYRVHGHNAYELQSPRLDLNHVRTTIGYADTTARALARLADELGYERPDPILSLSDLANRLLSRKLEPAFHPLPADRPWRLVADAVRATARRFDVPWSMKPIFVAWFAATAASPRPVVRWLGDLFMFPERRVTFNRLLARLHRASGRARTARSARL